MNYFLVQKGSLRRGRRRCYPVIAAGDGGVSEFCTRN